MDRQFGRSTLGRPPGRALASTFLTFSLLLLVLALGFALGRALVARVSVKRPLDFAKQAAQKLAGAPQAVPEAGGPSAQAYVPAPAEPHEQTGGQGQDRAAGPVAGGQPEVYPPEAGKSAPPPGASAEGQGSAESGPAPAPEAATEGEERFAVQVGLFISQQGARERADALARAGYPSRVEREQDGERSTYRVLTGRYRTEYAARRAAEQLTQEGFEAFVIKR
jgi:cell division protein FtsN